jgi:hypothetical protein
VFRRTTKTDSEETLEAMQKGPGAKGHATPTRKEAEAAARERARSPMDKKAAQKVMRERRTESNAKVRQGLRTGEERYLPNRDKGPVKRHIRTFLDSRLTASEFLLPLLLVIMVMQYAGSGGTVKIGLWLWQVTLLVVAVELSWNMFRLKKQLRTKFPDESLRGTTFYIIMRAIQLRWLRMPKPQVKVGGAPR